MNSYTIILVALSVVCCSTALQAASDWKLELVSDGGPWRFFPAQHRDEGVPNVLLIGDSIMNGYHGPVITGLKGKANVDYWLTPLHLASKDLHSDLTKILNHGVKYDVIHFNIGLHGWEPERIPEGQYEPLMRKYVDILRKYQTNACLTWASTTQITVKRKPAELDPVSNPVIVKRNAIAATVMEEKGITINDLYGLLVDKTEMMVGDKFHWTTEGYAVMSDHILGYINRSLAGKDRVKSID